MRRAVPLVVLWVLGAALLWRATLPPSPPALPAHAVFTQAQIDQAQDYRGPLYLLTLGAIALQLLVAGLLARRGDRLARLRWPAGVAGAVAAWVGLAALPFSAAVHARAADAGLDLRSWPAWLGDALIGVAVTALAVALLYGGGVVVWRRFGAWGAAAAMVVLFALLATLQPLVLDPLLFSTRPLPASLRPVVHGLEQTMGAHPRSVTVAVVGSDTTEENAQVDGVGPTVRVTLDDTSLQGATPGEIRLLVAHELGHVVHHHTLKGVLWFALLGVPALLLILRVVGRRVGDPDQPWAVPAVLFGVLLAATLLTPVANAISRRYEAEADYAALRATGDPASAVALEKRLALSNRSSLVPPSWAVWLLFDHPTVMDRIAVARAYRSGSSSSSSVSSPSNSGRFLMPSRVRHLE
jgi:STE24 endopeptidase